MQTEISRLEAADHDVVRDLILSGLEERWGFLNRELNPDLRDLFETFSSGAILVAKRGGRVVGAGGYVLLDASTAEIRRMSVDRHARRTGIGRRILDALLGEARNAGCSLAVLETTETWLDAIEFYLRNGFRETRRAAGEAWLERRL